MTTAGTVATFAMDPDAQDVVIAGVRTRVHVTAPEDRTTPTLVMLHGGDVRSLSHATDFSTVWTTSPAVPRLLAFDKPGQGWSFDADALDRGLTGCGMT
jgi:pimeloyl-ACP methyl ester carboxylesterase